MTRCGLTPSQMDEFIAVLMNQRQLDFETGAVRVRGLTKPVFAYLKRWHYLKRNDDGRYYPDNGRSTCYPIFSPRWYYLPIDLIWHIVEPMLKNDHAGYSITANERWALLNLYSQGQHGYTDDNEQEIMRVLCELAAYGYIWFQFGGNIWDIQRRREETSA